MVIKQMYSILNELAKETLGEGVVSNVDYENCVATGDAISDVLGHDNYVKQICDKIGRTIISIDAYKGSAPDIMRDKTEGGNIIEEILFDMPPAVENMTWNLENNHDYSADEHTFVQPGVSVKYYNQKSTYRLKTCSLAQRQVKDSFRTPEKMLAFFNGIETAYGNQKAVFNDNLTMMVIDNMIGETIQDGNANRIVNLLTMYNTATGQNLTINDVVDATTGLITDPELIRFIIAVMKIYDKRMSRMSTLYNIDGKERFTPAERKKLVVHNAFDAGAAAYLYSDSFNKGDVEMLPHETVVCWQGTGTDGAWASTSKIDIKTAGGDTVSQANILGIMFDRDACVIYNSDEYSSASFTASANFTNYFFFFDEGHINNLSKNFVVFLLA